MQHVRLGEFLEKTMPYERWRMPLGGGATMPHVSLGAFLKKAMPYERWRAPLDPHLRRALVLSGISICAILIGLCALPALLAFAGSGFFLVLGPVFGAILSLLNLASPLLLAVNALSAGVFLVMLAGTRGLQAGRAEWHWLAAGEVIVGAVDALILTLPLAIMSINLVLWVLLLVMGTVVLAVGLGGAGAAAGR